MMLKSISLATVSRDAVKSRGVLLLLRAIAGW